MSKTVVVVESPGKIKKIQEILGTKYVVVATYGHIIDLDQHKMSIDFNTFEPEYKPMTKPKNMMSTKKIITNIKTLYKNNNNNILIATDDDREGEMIAWSVEYILGISNAPRIIFNSITKDAIMQSIKNVKNVDLSIVEAQKTRRILDRIIGYKLSPLLLNKFNSYSLSAGRVQSVVARLVVDLEEEINSFFNKGNLDHETSTNESIKSLDSEVPPGSTFKINSFFENNINAILYKKSENNKKKSTHYTGDIWRENIDQVYAIIQKANTTIHTIKYIFEKKHINQPSPPFTTCTLQQEATKIGLNIKQTMDVAQKLYEGGYITYMRTDSIQLSKECLDNIKQYVISNYGEKYYEFNNHNGKTNNLSQEAHEAIRPININITNLPDLDNYANKLYNLIWKRTIMSQMASAIYQETVYHVDIDNIPQLYYEFSVNNSVFDGYLVINKEELIENFSYFIQVGDKLELIQLNAKEDFNRPKSRYNEAKLVKKMENIGVGRPATYAASLQKILNKGYIIKKDILGKDKIISFIEYNKKQNSTNIITENIKIGAEKNKLVPTELGKEIIKFLKDNFPKIIDYNFTAEMEHDLDKIAANEKQKNNVLKPFYDDFIKNIEEITSKINTNDNGTNDSGTNNSDTNNSGTSLKHTLANAILIGEENNLEYYIVNNKFGRSIAVKSLTNVKYFPFKYENKEYSLNEVKELISYPKILGIYQEKDIILKNGSYGLYVTWDNISVNVDNVHDIALDEIIILINKKKENNNNTIVFEDTNTTYKLIDGKFGPYVQVIKKNTKKRTTTNIKISKDFNFNDCTLKSIKEIVKNYKNNTKKTNTEKLKNEKSVIKKPVPATKPKPVIPKNEQSKTETTKPTPKPKTKPKPKPKPKTTKPSMPKTKKPKTSNKTN